MIRIEEIVENVASNHPQADLDLLRRAYLFSAREHKGQKRASGESYLVHPLEVANILADMRLDSVSVSTGLLHDVLEDCPTIHLAADMKRLLASLRSEQPSVTGRPGDGSD